MAEALKRYAGPVAVALLILIVGGAMLVGWQRYNRDYVVSVEEDGTAVTKVIAEKIAGTSSLKVSELSGTIQSSARDVRGFGWLKSDQVVKMPFSVDYFVNVGAIGADDLEWDAERRTLIVNAPDVTVGKPNVDESQRTLVRTSGLFVTREAGEELSRRTSAYAQAREYGRAALVKLMAAPLAAAGQGDARVIVTFPAERPNRDRWDVTTPVNEVLANRRQAR